MSKGRMKDLVDRAIEKIKELVTPPAPLDPVPVPSRRRPPPRAASRAGRDPLG